MAGSVTIRLQGSQARLAERMVRAGLAETLDEAVHLAMLHYGRNSGLMEEQELIQALRKAASKKPLSEEDLVAGIRRAKGARVPRR